MKNQPEKMKGVLYDYRWYREEKWVVPWTLLRFVKKFNNDVVYGNLGTDLFVSTPYRGMESPARMALARQSATPHLDSYAKGRFENN
jgi:hypothetical protein